MKKHYISAVLELLLEGRDVDVVLKDLAGALERKGHQKLYSPILKGVVRILEEKKNSIASGIIVAQEADFERLKKAIGEALEEIGGTLKDAHVAVDETLIGGFIATHKGKLINRSYKQKLVSLYRSITK
jgi:F0F1-type ATP synthase delta subunit